MRCVRGAQGRAGGTGGAKAVNVGTALLGPWVSCERVEIIGKVVHFPLGAVAAPELSRNSLAPRDHQAFAQSFPTSSLHLLTRNNSYAR